MKLARFQDKHYFIPDFGTYITPNGTPDEIIELDNNDPELIKKIKADPNDKNLHKKIISPNGYNKGKE